MQLEIRDGVKLNELYLNVNGGNTKEQYDPSAARAVAYAH